jgi:hypothetical protein
LSLQTSPEDQVAKGKSKSRADKLIRQKLDEEVFTRVTKNLKWVEVLHSIAKRALEASLELPSDESTHSEAHRREFAFLLERMKSAERCFSEVFTPILIGLYPHKFESTELFGKYIVASYELAKLRGTTQIVTEQLWEETLPQGTIEGDSVDSGKRVIEALSSASDQGDDEFLISIRHLHLAVTNFCSNVEQLKEQFRDDAEVKQLIGLLRPRIEQIEDTSSILYSYAKEKISTSTKNENTRHRFTEKAPSASIPAAPQISSLTTSNLPGLPSKTKVAKTPKKWKWEGRVFLSSIGVKPVPREKKTPNDSPTDPSTGS